MYTLWTILATSSDVEKVARSIFGWALMFLFVVYVFQDNDKEKKQKPKVQNKKVKSWVLLVFFSFIMMTSFNAGIAFTFSHRRSAVGALTCFAIFYLSAFGVKKMLNFRDLFRQKTPNANTKIGKRDT